MNSTRWVTLTEFVKHLGRSGIARVDETEKGWFLAWIDNSPKALAKQEASQAKERLTVSDEQRERNLIAEQIERAKADSAAEAGPSILPEEQGLKRDDNAEKVVLSFAAKPAAIASSSATATAPIGLKMNPLKATNPLKANPLKVNPLKANPLKANPLKANPSKRPAEATSSTSSADTSSKKHELSAAEVVMLEDQERKRRRMERDTITT